MYITTYLSKTFHNLTTNNIQDIEYKNRNKNSFVKEDGR